MAFRAEDGSRRKIRMPFLIAGGVAFAVVLTIGPILATRNMDAAGSADRFAANNNGMVAARIASALQAGLPGPGPAAVPAASQMPPAEPAGTLPADASIPESVAGIPIDGGEITLSLRRLDDASIGGGDLVPLEIEVTNTGDQYLWGVYAFLELSGRAECDDRQLAVGASTVCRADRRTWAGEETAVAWATAWTINRMVEGEAMVVIQTAP